MKDQKQPGKLLRQLRQKLGYTLEDWAAIFETTPTIVASIELGQEMPVEFLAKLIEWFIKTLEHPQKRTHILPHLPKKLEDWFKADYLPTDKETQELRKRVLDMVNQEINSQQQRIENYLHIIAGQEEQIEALEEQKVVDQKITRFQGISKVFRGILLFVAGGFLFTFAAQWLSEKSSSMEAISLEKMIAQRELPIPPTKKAGSLAISLPKSFPATKERKPLAHQAMPQPKIVENKSKPALNGDLFNLLAVNGERKMPVPQKYTSERGKTFLKFENVSKVTVVIAICNDKQQEIRRDTIKNIHFFLDIDAYAPGKYYYRMFTPSQRTEKTIGSFIIENKK